MDRLFLIEQFYRWFLSRSQPTSYLTVKRTAEAYWTQYHPDSSPYEGVNGLLNPLLRSGVVRFLPGNRFSLSPTMAYGTNSEAIIINAPDTIPEKALCPGIIKGPRHSLNHTAGLPIITLEVAKVLKKIPRIHTIIEQAKSPFREREDPNIDPSWEWYRKGKWMSTWDRENLPSTVLFRASNKPGSRRLLLMPNGRIYTVPAPDDNPGGNALAYVLALIASKANNEPGPIDINFSSGALTIATHRFPFELERLLCLEHLTRSDELVHLEHPRQYYLSSSTQQEVQRIFNL